MILPPINKIYILKIINLKEKLVNYIISLRIDIVENLNE